MKNYYCKRQNLLNHLIIVLKNQKTFVLTYSLLNTTKKKESKQKVRKDRK